MRERKENHCHSVTRSPGILVQLIQLLNVQVLRTSTLSASNGIKERMQTAQPRAQPREVLQGSRCQGCPSRSNGSHGQACTKTHPSLAPAQPVEGAAGTKLAPYMGKELGPRQVS